MKRNTSLLLIPLFVLSISSCNRSKPNITPSSSTPTPIPVVQPYGINIKTSIGLELKSQDRYKYNPLGFTETIPIFEDEHISSFVTPVYQYPTSMGALKEGYYQLNIQLTARTKGSLYFDSYSDGDQIIQDSLRIELHHYSSNKSVIYANKEGENIIEGNLDLNNNGLLDRDGFDTSDEIGELVHYTTGVHSYHKEQYNSSPFITVSKDEIIELRTTIFMDLFTAKYKSNNKNIHQIDLSFSLK